jgi:hypothetical protein
MSRFFWLSILSGLGLVVLAAQASAQFTPRPPVVELPFDDVKAPPIEVKPIKIDPNTPVRELLPPAPKTASKIPAPFNVDLELVPEVIVGEPIAKNLNRPEGINQMALRFTKISHLNQKKRDGFLDALIAERTELQGMPFAMGDACRTDEAKGRIMPFLSQQLNQSVRNVRSGFGSNSDFEDLLAELQTRPTVSTPAGVKVRVSRDNEDAYYRALVATLIQVLGPESEAMRTRLARSLATIPHIDATKALARLAIFAPEQKVRDVALDGLKLRRDKDYTDVLMAGFQYPLPEVSKRAAQALVKLERKDVVPELVSVLEQPDPRMPVTKREQGKEVAMVRELVRVNHHHNCVMCHAPANTPDVPNWALQVGVPLPGDPFPPEGGYMDQFRTPTPSVPGILVRIDMTYLKQDFSLMMPVVNPEPWPRLQRFDFFVRTRALSAQEAQAWQSATKAGPTPYQQSAVLALRELTGRDAEPSAEAWRAILKQPRQ